nr:hypothetical protein Iba_chr08bCG7070 [Ipomoea batatas]
MEFDLRWVWVWVQSSSPKSKLADFPDLGTAGAMEKRAALKVATRRAGRMAAEALWGGVRRDGLESDLRNVLTTAAFLERRRNERRRPWKRRLSLFLRILNIDCDGGCRKG